MDNIDVGILSQIVKEWGVVAVLVWYIYYTQTKTIPSLVTAFKEEIQLERAKSEKIAENIISAINNLSNSLSRNRAS